MAAFTVVILIILALFLAAIGTLLYLYVSGTWPYKIYGFYDGVKGKWLNEHPIQYSLRRDPSYNCGSYCGNSAADPKISEIYSKYT